MKKILKKGVCLLLVLIICMTSISMQNLSCLDFFKISAKASNYNYGSCGPDANWYYNPNTKNLRIYGTGYITEKLSGNYYPWAGLDVTSVTVAEGITKIPSYTFEYQSKIKTINLPSTLKYLALNAFNDCLSLNNLLLPSSIVEFTYNYFNRCPSLKDVYYMGTVEEWKTIENSSIVSFFPTNQVATIHYLNDLSVKPTCQSEGTETYYQFDKTDVYGSLYDINKKVISQPKKLPVVDHSYTNYQSNNDATCTLEGTKTAFCDYNCGNSNTVAEAALGHDFNEFITTKDATCTVKGEERADCSRCDYFKTRKTTALGHNLGEFYIAKEATCTEKGQERADCSRCDYYESRETTALGHNLGEFYVAQEATCTEKGQERADCSRCDYYESIEIALIPHDYKHIITYPDCLNIGYTTFTCYCGNTYTSDIIDALGHEDSDFDGYCDSCEEFVADEGCLCICHDEHVFGLVYRIIYLVQTIVQMFTDVDLFSKVLNLDWLCRCGIAHY